MRTALVVALVLGAAAGAAAQPLPDGPISLGGGRLVVGGDAAVSVAPEDVGFFNYADYEQSTLRQVRLGLSGRLQLTPRLALLGEIRTENFDHVTPLALFARIQPLPGRRLDIQIGRIPPTVGSAGRRTYSRENPLIGHPLAYQYLTSLRADALPASVDELLRMRGRGWLASYTRGRAEPDRGVPLVSAFTWDTGVQVTTGWRAVTLTGAVTTGTASNPRVGDDNGGRQIALRVSAEPAVGLVAGASLARGEFVARHARAAAGAAGTGALPQRVAGLDLEYSRGHGIVRADAMVSEWTIPIAAAGARLRLRAAAVSLEGRYTLRPGLYGAVRAEHLAFNRVAGATRVDEWDAPVTRLEVGGGYYLQRNVIARASLQWNTRDGGRVTRQRFVAAQLLYWF